ncbi:FecR family protein [Segatella paludivivens]|uniref:FecR family protein n=1 Tax=Segatella paludivivens TaxID=185294 RepID=UPI000366DF40|nr:FecR domain-containing protein [Segatella paludivivens]
MKKQEDKSLEFVIKHYKYSKLDSNAAYHRLAMRIGIQKHSHKLWWAAAASFLLLLSFAGIYNYLNQTTTLYAAASTTTYTLADGTKVTLSPQSSLSYKGTNCRDIEITGKVYLDIFHNPSKPFTISDDSYRINDIGTRLEVDKTTNSTTVYVDQGAVSFASTADISDALVINQGCKAILRKSAMHPERMATESANCTSWATHKFQFRDTPLREVLADLSDYYKVSFVSDKYNVNLTADFKADNLNTIINMIQKSLDVKIKYKSNSK